MLERLPWTVAASAWVFGQLAACSDVGCPAGFVERMGRCTPADNLDGAQPVAAGSGDVESDYTGVPIPSSGYAVVSGADKKWYLFRVNEMMTFLERTFGIPDRTAKSPYPAHFSGLKGLLVVKGNGWTNARGHVTLWSGSHCSDSCHLSLDPDNGTFVPEVASLWKLS